MYSKEFVLEFWEPRERESALEQKHMDLAASLQKLTEEIIVKMAKHVRKETGMKNLCLAGGVALNVVANKRILEESGFEKMFVQPAASDAGGALGIAYFIYHQLLDNERSYEMNHAYLGPGFHEKEIKNFIEANKIIHRRYDDKELVREVARLISENKIVGWFQGRMEWGPRALGNRSILANPCNPEMKDILNNKVKHREDFRPFAPVTHEEKAPEFFEMSQPDPFMTILFDVKRGKRESIPAVTHVDGTGRLQTTTRKTNRKYYELIEEFGRITGVPVLINTSFNVRGEPIVCTPEDAYKCFMGTGIDILVLGNYIIKKG
jgi:carbamoyltransferase